MTRLAHLLALLRVSALIVLVLLAAALGVLRLALTQADTFREPLLAALAEPLGGHWSAEHLSLGLSRWRLRLELHQPRPPAAPSGAQPPQLQALAVELDPWASLLAREVRLSAVRLDGLRVGVWRETDGTWRIQGLERANGGDPARLAAMLGEADWTLSDTRVCLIRRDVCVDELNLWLRHFGRTHRLDLATQLSGTGLNSPLDVQLSARLRGATRAPATWSGQLATRFAADRLASTSVSNWLDELAALGLPLAGFRLPAIQAQTEGLTLQTWARLDAGALEQVTAQLTLDTATFSPTETSPTLALDALQSTARLRSSAQGWLLDLAGLRARVNGQVLGLVDARLVLDAARHPRSVGVALGQFDLAGLNQVLEQLAPHPRSPALREWLEHEPRGVLRHVRGALSINPETAQRWWLSAELADARWPRLSAPGADVPGVEGLNLQLDADQQGGRLALYGTDSTLDVGTLFSAPLNIEQLDTALEWHVLSDGGWQLATRHLHAMTPELMLEGRLALEHPAGGEPLLDLRASLRDRGQPVAVQPYLPRARLHPRLLGWLDQALGRARVPRAELLLRGPPAAYPFRDHRGRFELRLKFADLALAYAREWPALEQAQGVLHLSDAGLELELDTARVLDTRIDQLRMAVADLRESDALPIRAAGIGPFQDVLHILRDTPLRTTAGAVAAQLEAAGQAQLDLELAVPIRGGGKIEVDGRLRWPERATLSLRETPLRLESLDGEVQFTRQGLSAEALSAELWGQPLRLALSSRTPGPGLRIEARSRTPITELARQFPARAWSLLDGELDWQLALEATGAQSQLEWQLDSSLAGTAIRLPEPLAKPMRGTRVLSLSGVLDPGQRISASGRLGEVALSVAQDLGRSGPPGVRLRFGGGGDAPGAAPESGALVIEGALAALDLNLWREWLESAQSGSGAGAARLAQLDLELGQLRFNDWSLPQSRLGIQPQRSGWQVTLDSQALRGRVSIPGPRAAEPVRIDLDQLDLAALVGTMADAPSGRSRAPVPTLDLAVDALRWKDQQLGRFEGQLRPHPSGWRVPLLRLEGSELLAFEGSAGWNREAGGSTRLQLKSRGESLGALLGLTGAGQAIEHAPVEAELDLSWPGGVGDFALEHARGVIELDTGSGRLLALEPGVGRVLGVLNPGALGRRLALDFSDLYAQGFAFNRMHGRVELNAGEAVLKDFDIEGPSSRLIISGLTDLSAQTFDQEVILEPRISSSVALASAVAGGPVLGAAVYLVDLAAGNPIDRMGRTRYRVSGAWDEPDVERLGFEAQARASDEAAAHADDPNWFLDAD